MDQDALIVWCIFGTQLGQVGGPAIYIAIDRVVDHFNPLLHIEHPHGAITQVIRDVYKRQVRGCGEVPGDQGIKLRQVVRRS